MKNLITIAYCCIILYINNYIEYRFRGSFSLLNIITTQYLVYQLNYPNKKFIQTINCQVRVQVTKFHHVLSLLHVIEIKCSCRGLNSGFPLYKNDALTNQATGTYVDRPRPITINCNRIKIHLYPYWESNPDPRLRRSLYYPLYYTGLLIKENNL